MNRRPLYLLSGVLALAAIGLSGFFLARMAGNSTGFSAFAAAEAAESPPGRDGSRSPASLTGGAGVPLVSLEEVYVNVGDAGESHSLAVKMELELFEYGSRDVINKFQSSLRHAVIQTSLEQDYEELQSLAGKLFFKELLVARMNDILREPAIRDVHFSSFYLR